MVIFFVGLCCGQLEDTIWNVVELEFEFEFESAPRDFLSSGSNMDLTRREKRPLLHWHKNRFEECIVLIYGMGSLVAREKNHAEPPVIIAALQKQCPS
jgi:hypothetical protein